MADSARVVPSRTFESIVKALRPSGAFREQLIAAGFDPDAPEDAYPVETWRAVMEVARLNCFAELEPARAFRTIGYAAVDGFRQTLVGRVYGLMFPLLGPERVLAAFPRYVALVRPDATVSARPEGRHRWRLTMHVPVAYPDFTAGVLERALLHAGVHATVEVQNQDGDRYDLLAQW